jgi:hypothetical protein
MKPFSASRLRAHLLGRRSLNRTVGYAAAAAFILALSATHSNASTLTHGTAMLFTPFDNFFGSFSTLMTTTVARVGSLAAIVICGHQYAIGEPGAKKVAVGTAIGVGIANMAPAILSWVST